MPAWCVEGGRGREREREGRARGNLFKTYVGLARDPEVIGSVLGEGLEEGHERGEVVVGGGGVRVAAASCLVTI